MKLLEFCRSLFRPASTPTPANHARDDATVAVAEPPAAEPPAAEGPAPDANGLSEPLAEPSWWIPRGEPVRALPDMARLARTVDAALYDHCARLLDSADIELPRLPRIAQQLVFYISSPDADLRKAADIAERDPSLVAQFLRVANSAAYRGATEIRRLDQAFSRMGQRAIQAAVLSGLLKQTLISTGGSQMTLGEELWRRSVAAGVIVQELSREEGDPVEDGFFIGLLHDIGMLAVLKLVHDFQCTHGRKVPRVHFEALAAQWHEHLGLRLAEAWCLPDPLPQLIGHHHRTPSGDDPLRRPRLFLAIAEVTCALLEYAPYVPYDFFALECVQAAGLVDDEATRQKLARWPALIKHRLSWE